MIECLNPCELKATNFNNWFKLRGLIFTAPFCVLLVGLVSMTSKRLNQSN